MFSFRAIYRTEDYAENVFFLNYDFKDTIIDVDIVGEGKVEPYSNYTFLFPGNHIVYILIDITNLESLSNMFYEMENMTSIFFSKEFVTKI